MKPLTKIIFLDIDGVLTSVENGTSFLCEKPENYRLEKKCLDNILLLKKQFPDLMVVISSAWLNHCKTIDDEKTTWYWKNIQFKTQLPILYRFLIENNMFAGVLDNRCKANCGVSVKKYYKVKDWICNNRKYIANGAKLLVLDDEGDYTEFEKINILNDWKFLFLSFEIAFQKVNYYTGFNSKELDKSIKFFLN